MTIILEPYEIPEKGDVELKIERAFEVKITAAEAQRRVRAWLRDEISMLIDADPPTLVVGEQVVWRVPAWIGFPHTGRAGEVGFIDVDVTSGAMPTAAKVRTTIEQNAEAIAARQPTYRPQRGVPEAYIAKNFPTAPALQILADGSITRVETATEAPG